MQESTEHTLRLAGQGRRGVNNKARWLQIGFSVENLARYWHPLAVHLSTSSYQSAKIVYA
jgi:hypothetical protein